MRHNFDLGLILAIPISHGRKRSGDLSKILFRLCSAAQSADEHTRKEDSNSDRGRLPKPSAAACLNLRLVLIPPLQLGSQWQRW